MKKYTVNVHMNIWVERWRINRKRLSVVRMGRHWESFHVVQLKVNKEEAAWNVRGGVAGGPASCDSYHM